MMQLTNALLFKLIKFIGLLQIAFIVLKLCSVIGWAWYLVLIPAMSIAVLVVLIIIANIIYTKWLYD